MTEDKLKEYASNGGNFFSVLSIGVLKDGGTKTIHTSKGTYYIDKDTKKIHSDYPITDDNLIDNEILIEYIIYKMEIYVERQYENLERVKNLIKEMKKPY